MDVQAMVNGHKIDASTQKPMLSSMDVLSGRYRVAEPGSATSRRRDDRVRRIRGRGRGDRKAPSDHAVEFNDTYVVCHGRGEMFVIEQRAAIWKGGRWRRRGWRSSP
jgi:hypothetical protein